MSKFIVTKDALCAAHNEHTGHLLTWNTREGAQKFADMNGGFVTPFSVIDASVSTIGPPVTNGVNGNEDQSGHC